MPRFEFSSQTTDPEELRVLTPCQLALSTGVQGIGLVYDASQPRGSSQGEPIEVIDKSAVEVIQHVKRHVYFFAEIGFSISS